VAYGIKRDSQYVVKEQDQMREAEKGEEEDSIIINKMKD